MTKTMKTHLICTIAALLSLHLTNFGTANSDEMIIDPVIEPPVILPEPSPLIPISPVVGPPVILPEPLPVLPIGPTVAPPLTQPEPLPLIPGPGGTWSPTAQPKLEDSSDSVPDPVVGPPVILPKPLPVLPIGPIVAPPLTQPEPLPLIPGPGGTSSSSAQPKLEDSLYGVPDPTPLQQTPPVVFDYSQGPNGPEHWGELKADWAICKSGSQQSPLSITPNLVVTDSSLGNLKANYTAERVNVTISHDGLDLKVDVPSSAGVLKIYNVTYRPVSFHFHRPSEHRILNYSFPLELHLVHKSEDGKIAVVAWLFIPGSKNNTFLAQFLDELPTHKNPYKSLKIPPIKLPQLEPNYGRYRGSLTTPPCSETVIWTLMLWNFPSVSDYQLKQLKAAVPRKNTRPSFPSNGRKFRINHTPNWTVMEKAFKDVTASH